MNITLNDDEYIFCKHLADLRTQLQNSGNDPSLRYTTPTLDRGANNIIGQVAEYAVLKYLYGENIPFSAVCFAITYVYGSTGVLPPLADFILVGGKSLDIKTDRYPIGRLGALIPVEKLKDIHLTDYTIWVEFNESNNNKTVKLHGWNTIDDIIGFRNLPDAVEPNGKAMKKPCKRIKSEHWREMSSFAETIRTNLDYRLPKYRISTDVVSFLPPTNEKMNQSSEFLLGQDNNWVSGVVSRYLNSERPIKLTIIPFKNNKKNGISVTCELLDNGVFAAHAYTLLDGIHDARLFYSVITSAIENWLNYMDNFYKETK